MFSEAIKNSMHKKVEEMKQAGLYKEEQTLLSAQGAHVRLESGEVLNFCSNNYLGLSNSQVLIEAATQGMKTHGFGLSSVRFISGTQDIHKELEKKLAAFLGTEDAILYSSCFDANAGLFETLLSPEDAVLSDQLNHASIIDGIRLCKAQKFVYANRNMQELENHLQQIKAVIKIIVTDGVFSMDGTLAPLKDICDLAEKYDAMVMVDDSHATGFMGKEGKGTPEYWGVMDSIDIITGTFGKALGGASGGFTAGKKEIIALLRQRSRPYLFSNTLAPGIVHAALAALTLVEKQKNFIEELMKKAAYVRKKLSSLGFKIPEGIHPIIPVMLEDEHVTQAMASKLLEKGIYVRAFAYPVVAKGKARIRIQVSAAHSLEDLDSAINAFESVGQELNVLK